MSEHRVELPGVAGEVRLRTPGLFGGIQLLVDGRPAERLKGRRYRVPRSDGRSTEVQLVMKLTESLPIVVSEGVEHRIGPRIPLALVVLSFLPIGLVAVGGAIGGAFGGLGWGLCQGVARSKLGLPAKVGAMVLITAGAFGAWFLVGGALHLAITSRGR